MDFSNYNNIKINICDQIQHLQKIAADMGMGATSDYLNNSLQRLQDEHFNLVVVGMFSRGKSTFVDALLGHRILPTSKKPTTAIISKIVYGNHPSYILHFKDKTIPEKTLSEEEFRSLTAPKSVDTKDEDQVRENLQQQDELDRISEAVVKYPLDICKNGVYLVDTPGMNDVNRTRIEITYQYLQNADAVIMMLAADQMLSVSEVEFLKERILSRQIKDVFYIINRKDTLSGPEEEAKVIDFAKRNLKEIIPPELSKELHIFLVSSYQALLSRRHANGEELTNKQMTKIPNDFSITGFLEFEESLSNFLINEKGYSKLEMYKSQAEKKAEEMVAEINDALGLLGHSLDDISEKIRILEPEFKQARTKSERIVKDMQMNLERYTNHVSDQCNAVGDDILVSACNVVDNYQGKLESTRIKQEINEAVARQQKKFIDEMVKYQSIILEGELTKAQERLREIWKDIDTKYRSSLNLPMAPQKHNITIVAPSTEISNSRGALGSYAFGGSIGALLAGAVFPALAIGAVAAWCFGFFDNNEEKAKQNIKRQLLDQIPKMVSQLTTNVVGVYNNRCEEIITLIKDSIDSRISSMEEMLTNTLQEKKNQEQKQEEHRRFLEGCQSKVIKIKNSLSL